MKKHPGLESRRKSMPLDIKLSIDLSFETIKRIKDILRKQGRTQKDLAVLLKKKESEISKWMAGTHNFTYSTIAKIQSVLGEKIVEVSKEPNLLETQIASGKVTSIIVYETGEFVFSSKPFQDNNFPSCFQQPFSQDSPMLLASNKKYNLFEANVNLDELESSYS